DAQRLLEPLDYAIPFAPRLAFPTSTTKARRDNVKLLSLVGAHALLYQRQRERDPEKRVIATVQNYNAVFELFAPLVEAEVDDLSPQGAALYRALVRERRGPVTRREVAALLGWSYGTTRRALDELAAHELLRLTNEDVPRR